MMCTQGFGVLNMLTGIANMHDWVVLTAFVIVPASSFVLNVFLLLGLRSWFVLPAAVISMFINITWATGSTAQFRTSRWSSWPAWVMEFVYCGGTMFFMVISSSVFGSRNGFSAAIAACSQGSRASYRSANSFALSRNGGGCCCCLWS